MPFKRVIIFTDRDGDVLSVVPREGKADPIISVDVEGRFHSIVMNDDELDEVMRGLGDAFGYTVYKNVKRKD